MKHSSNFNFWWIGWKGGGDVAAWQTPLHPIPRAIGTLYGQMGLSPANWDSPWPTLVNSSLGIFPADGFNLKSIVFAFRRTVEQKWTMKGVFIVDLGDGWNWYKFTEYSNLEKTYEQKPDVEMISTDFRYDRSIPWVSKLFLHLTWIFSYQSHNKLCE